MAEYLRKLHPRASTTRAKRLEIQESEESDRALAARLKKNVKTVAKWRKRDSTNDAPMGPKRELAGPLSPRQEALIVVFRKVTRASLERPLSVWKPAIPQFKRSTLYRCHRKWGVSRLLKRRGGKDANSAGAARDGFPAVSRLRVYLHSYQEVDGEAWTLATCFSEVGDLVGGYVAADFDGPCAKSLLDQVLEEADCPIRRREGSAQTAIPAPSPRADEP